MNNFLKEYLIQKLILPIVTILVCLLLAYGGWKIKLYFYKKNFQKEILQNQEYMIKQLEEILNEI